MHRLVQFRQFAPALGSRLSPAVVAQPAGAEPRMPSFAERRAVSAEQVAELVKQFLLEPAGSESAGETLWDLASDPVRTRNYQLLRWGCSWASY